MCVLYAPYAVFDSSPPGVAGHLSALKKEMPGYFQVDMLLLLCGEFTTAKPSLSCWYFFFFFFIHPGFAWETSGLLPCAGKFPVTLGGHKSPFLFPLLPLPCLAWRWWLVAAVERSTAETGLLCAPERSRHLRARGR